MRCDDFREASSARLDHEDLPDGVTGAALDAHLATCADCLAWADVASSLHRQVRMRPARPQPDRTEALLAAVPLASRPRPVREGVRYALLAVGLAQVLLALPALFLGAEVDAPVHVAREMGAFELALGVGLLSAAWRPRLATGLLPFAAALAGAVLVTAVVDVVRGQAVALSEAHHVLDLAGVALLWLLQTRPGRALRGQVDLVGA
ncbi:zf-HC2 domain-containing protein [Iamia majanohamensis]|uniref:Zf-HC2 domain-containing protein n=1 Tax=Iamia majanohamensis TaxID=467976 RepID=A0AAF0BRN0_9ACTN|nr:zf-HC2 domain-containing protein [Iamia majanohamensis]WCO66981.1 zf-HC2 domain-containing protein [Iamia majanohamensis]